MLSFTKEILPEGQYLVTTPTGSRILKEFSADYLKTVAKNATDMIAAGLRIPIPFRHSKDAVPLEENIETDSFDNAGYWTSVYVDNVDGVATLCGVADSPGNIDDMDTPAGKLCHRVKEVSACIVDSWRDGKNRAWGPSMLHGAAVVNPVVPGQKEFALLSFPGDSVMLSMSSMLDQAPSMESIATLSKELEKSVGIYIPPGTLPQDLIKVLLVSLKQHSLTSDQSIEDQEIIDTQSIFMSLPKGKKMPLKKVQAEELVALGALHPETKKPFKIEDFDIDDAPTPESQYALALTVELVGEKKTGLKNRVNHLVNTGRTTKEYAESTLYPEVDKYELSLGEGAKFRKNAIDFLVESLEALPVPEGQQSVNLAAGIPDGHVSHEGSHNDANGVALTAEEAESMKKELLACL